ncbi:MAG: type II toxin-antitoxin system PemK/MazF family toxin [Anaerolineae bacterium]|nr:type II toxin-antitoxin system PemK/MazF family toxin [Anaerolineae bacterium]
MKYKIVLVPFPFDDLSATKVRPAVCLTEPVGMHRHVVLAFITSQVLAQPAATDFVIQSSDKNFAKTGLAVSSTIQLHRLVTVTTALIKRELGQLPPDMQVHVKEKIMQLFELA